MDSNLNMDKALRLYKKIRSGDEKLNKKVENVSNYIYNLIGIKPSIVGSVAMGINIFGSDIDFAIGVTAEQRKKIQNKLDSKMEYRGERIATSNSTRLLYCTQNEGTHIDLNILNESDFKNLLEGARRANSDMTENEKAMHVYNKVFLDLVDPKKYEDYKLKIYKKYNPEFSWIPDYEIRENIANKLKVEGEKLPPWLSKGKEIKKADENKKTPHTEFSI